jgi:hypothetical protein
MVIFIVIKLVYSLIFNYFIMSRERVGILSPAVDCCKSKPSNLEYSYVIKHPRLTKLLESIKQPSPQRITRDRDQPISGSLLDLKCMKDIKRRIKNTSPDSGQIPTVDFKSRLSVNKPDIVLQLGASYLDRRRALLRRDI